MLTRIDDLDTYKSLIRKVRSKGKLRLTNNFMLPEQIRSVIEKSHLYFYEDIYSTYFFVTHNSYYELLIMSTDLSQLSIVPTSFPVKFDLTTRRGVISDQGIQEAMEKSSFEFLANNIEMNRTHTTSLPDLKMDENLKMKRMEPSDIDEVMSIWLSELDDEMNPIPKREDILDFHEAFYTVYYGNQIVGGVLIENQGIRKRIEHLALARSFQGRGLGSLVLYSIITGSMNKDYCLWVDQTNEHAVGLYKAFGFTETNRISMQFIRRKTYERTDSGNPE